MPWLTFFNPLTIRRLIVLLLNSFFLLFSIFFMTFEYSKNEGKTKVNSVILLSCRHCGRKQWRPSRVMSQQSTKNRKKGNGELVGFILFVERRMIVTRQFENSE